MEIFVKDFVLYKYK